jgi:hypothetical protein
LYCTPGSAPVKFGDCSRWAQLIANKGPGRRSDARAIDFALTPPNKDAEMRIIILPLAAAVVLATASVQAAPIPITRHAKSHETPGQNVRKSEQYDHLVSTNPSFRAARMKKECGPIRDPGLRNTCLDSFREYEPH